MSHAILARQFESGRWIYLHLGGENNAWWCDSMGYATPPPSYQPVPEPINRVRLATPEEIQAACFAMWPGAKEESKH